MSNHPPERYEPGELDKTRNNLGDLTEDEAREMVRLLNGEIGVEKTSPAIQEQYRRLQQLNRRTGDSRIPARSRKFPEDTGSGPGEGAGSTLRLPGFMDRVRTNFWAASSTCTIIPRIQAMGTLISFIVPLQERLHPYFILKGDQVFYNHLERLVLAVRSLMAINRRDEVPSLMDHRSLKILSLLRQWDIETVHRELTVLQRDPRRQPLIAAARLCRALYRPMFQLVELDPAEHLVPVIKRLFDLDLMAYPPDSREADRIKRIGTTLKQELFHLFFDVKRRCAPLLIKLAATPYAPYPEVLDYFRPGILKFLELSSEDIIPRESRDLLIRQADESTDIAEGPNTVETEEQAEEIPQAEGEEVPPLPEQVIEACRFLTRMFPQSGVDRLENFPDLFGYFKPIVSFPKNTDLFNPANPVHQIATLLAVLQEFFYGFRQILFSEVLDAEDNAREIQSEVDQHLSRWHRLLDELVCGRLLTELVDYCRQVERSPEYRNSEPGLKQENSILVRMRRGILPHLEVPTLRISSQGSDRGLPGLHIAVSEFYRLLQDALAINPETGKSGMHNPNSPFHFEIENFITIRFRRYLRKKGLPQDNRHLVHYTALLLGLLDYLINNPESHLYREGSFPLYRHEKGHKEIPIYSVPGLQTERIIESSDIELTPPEDFLDESGKSRDKVSGLNRGKGYVETVKAAVDEFHESGRQISIAVISIPELRIQEPGTRDDNLRVIGHTVRGEIREYSDLPFRLDDDTIPVILPETGTDAALSFCRRLIGAVKTKLPQTGIHVGVLTYHPTWSAGKFIKTAARTAAEAERRRSPVILIYRESDADFEEIPLEL